MTKKLNSEYGKGKRDGTFVEWHSKAVHIMLTYRVQAPDGLLFTDPYYSDVQFTVESNDIRRIGERADRENKARETREAGDRGKKILD
jgi:hypothetical protein